MPVTDNILDRDPIEVARKIVFTARRHGPQEAYVDGHGRMTLRRTSVVYPKVLPDLWLVGTYRSDASVVRVMEDIELRLAEVRAANG